MNPEQLLCLASARGVNLDSVTRGSAPEWTPDDLGIGLAGLPALPTAAALYSWAGDASVAGDIKYALMRELLIARDALQWAGKVERSTGERSKFSEELVELFLDEERAPHKYRAVPLLRAVWMRVEWPTWRRVLDHQYAYVGGVYSEALTAADYHLRRRLRRA